MKQFPLTIDKELRFMAVQTKVLDFDSKGLKRVKILLKSDNAGGTCVTNRVLFAKKEIHLDTVEADLLLSV